MDIEDVPSACGKKVVLICDDSKTTLHAMKAALSKYYHIITASSGYEAISFALLYAPDIVVIDVMMYGMNGFETLVKLKNNIITKDISVIFLSGLTEKKYKEKALELGAVEYLDKPFDLRVLLENIEKFTVSKELCYEGVI